MALYIDKIDDKSIKIKKVDSGNVSFENCSHATFKASVGAGGFVTIRDKETGVSYSVNLAELYINGDLSPQNMDDAIVALEFIGNFKSPGGTGTNNPKHNDLDGRDEEDCHPIPAISGLSDNLIALRSKIDSMINDADLDSVITTVSARRTMHIPVMQVVDKNNYVAVKVKALTDSTEFTEGQDIMVNGVSCKIPKLSFNPSPVSTPFDTIFSHITYTNGMFFAFAANTSDTVGYSYDGKTWMSTTLPVSTILTSVVWGGDKFVAVGKGSIAYYSYDGITWTQTSATALNTRSGIVYDGNKFVALEDSGYIYYSYDGIAWTRGQSLYSFSNSTWWNIAYGNGVFVAVATSGAAYSYDGLTWLKIPSLLGRSVAYGNGMFIIFSSGSGLYYSYDGVNWVKSNLGFGSYGYSITYGNGVFVAAFQANFCLYSYDGINWAQIILPNNLSYGVAYGNGIFVLPENGTTNAIIFEFNLLPTNSALILNDPSAIYDNNPFGTYLVGGTPFEVQTSYSVGTETITSQLKRVSEADPLVQKSYLEFLLQEISAAIGAPITAHNLLSGRDDFYCHTIDSITGLVGELLLKADKSELADKADKSELENKADKSELEKSVIASGNLVNAGDTVSCTKGALTVKIVKNASGNAATSSFSFPSGRNVLYGFNQNYGVSSIKQFNGRLIGGTSDTLQTDEGYNIGKTTKGEIIDITNGVMYEVYFSCGNTGTNDRAEWAIIKIR